MSDQRAVPTPPSKNGVVTLSMVTYFLLALRNLTRNMRRTVLTLIALVVAIGSLTFMLTLTEGYLGSMKDNFVLTNFGHIQINAPGFQEDGLIDNFMADTGAVIAAAQADPNVIASSQRVYVSGLANVATASAAITVIGVEPEKEKAVTRMANFVTDGAWLEVGDNGGVVLGIDVAETLEAELGDKVVMTTQAPGGDFSSQVFRVRGIIESGTPEIDRLMAIVTLEAAQTWLELGDGATTVVLRVDNHENTDLVYERMLDQLDGQLFETQRWFDVDPFIQQIVESSDASIVFILAIVVVVVLGEIINTMFMTLYERTREFGLMEALGTGRRQLFAMLLWETTVLVSIGGALGYGGAAILTGIYGKRGIDLTAFTESLSSLYMDPIIHPVMDLKITIYILATIAITALLAGVLPAWRATKLNPVEAMRQI